MSIIHILDRQTDRILDDITEKYILENVHEQSLKDTLESFEFVTFGDKPFSKYLEKRNKIIIPLEDEGYQEFVISETDKNHEDETNEITVYCDASYLELKKLNPIEPQTFEDYTASTALAVATRNTPWQVGIVESSGTRTFSFDEYTNPFEFIKKIAKEFELEVKFRVEVDGNRIIGRFVDLVKRIGQYHGVEVEFGKNLKGIRRIENTDEVYTALIGLGPEKEDGTRAVAFVYDNDALQRWGIRDKNGNLQHLIGVHEVQSENTEMTPDEVARYTKIVLDRRTNAVVEYEGSLHDLEHVPGLQNKKIRFGDTIRIKDTKFNPPLYLEARIHTLKRDIVDKSKKDVVLGDYIEYTEDEVRAVWRQLQKEINRKIDLYQLLEYTYDKETIDKKDQIILGDGKEYSRNVAKEAEDKAKEHADSVAREAERLAKEYADGQINQSESRILEKTVAKAIFETTVSELLAKLADKADNSVIEEMLARLADKAEVEWVEGQLQLKADNTTVTAINETVNELQDISATLEQTIADYAEELENQGGKIINIENNLDTIEGKLATTITSLSNLENTVSQQQTQIEANSSEIALKASQDDLDKLSGTVSTISGELSVLAGQISAKAEQSFVEELEKDLTNVTNNLATLTVDVSGIKTDVSTLTQKVTDHGTKISDINSSITQLSGLIESKVDSTTYEADIDGIIKNLQNHETRISQTETEITTKVERTEFEAIEKKVGELETSIENAWTEINQNADEIALKASQSSVDTLSKEVSDLEAELTIQAGKIASKVDQSEFDSVTNTLGNRIATVEQTAEGIRTEVSDIRANVYTKSEVDSAIGGIQVGGRNLIRNSDFGSDGVLDHWDYWGNSSSMSVENHYGYNFLRVTSRSNMRGEYYWFRRRPQEFNFVKGVKYTLSWIQVMSAGTEDPRVVIREAGGQGYQQMLSNFKTETILRAEVYGLTRNFVKYSITFEISDAINEPIADIAWRFTNTRDGREWVMISEPKLEKGNKATDWTPAPEDVQDQINDIEGTLESHSTKIEQNAQQIQLRATKTEVDTLTGRVNQAESQITQLAGQIELRATKTEVDALTGRVSTVESTIQQHANMIQSKIDDGQARSIFRQEADSFTFDASQINFKGHIFGEDAVFMGSIGTPMLTVGAEDITGYENFGLRLQTAQWQSDPNEPFRKTGHIEFNTLNNGLEIIKYNLDKSTGYLDYFEVYARAFRIWGDIYVGGSGWVYTAAIDFPVGYAPGEHIYLRPATSTSEVRATVTGTTNRYVDMRARTFLAGGASGNGTFTTESGYVVLRAGDDDSIAYIQSNREVRATRRMQGSSYVPVRASSFPTGSLEEFKTNIKKWEESALAIIRDSDIYEFQLKNDLENGKIKTRYGLVIGEGYNTPEEVIDGDGIELYAMNSISWKAIQELDREQKDLKSRIAWLEAENERLMQKIKYLEGKIA